VLGSAFIVALVLFAFRGPQGPDTSRDYPSRTLPLEPVPVLLPPPEINDEFFPCTDCHVGEPANRKVRVLEDEHDDLELRHGTIWCYDCHDAEEQDALHLTNDTLVAFEESWRLCTQCHGLKLADWRAGVHGKRTGSWWGPKEYRNCVECHDPHSPLFKPLEPLAPPWRPEQLRWAREQSTGATGE
jgi:hypothetical protein